MDHGEHTPDGDEMDGCSMQMIFHAGHCEVILFPSWVAKSLGAFIGATIAIFCVAILYEGLKYLREKLLADFVQAEYARQAITNKDGHNISIRRTPRELMFSKIHILQSVLHLIQVAVSYSLMLIVMTYNVWLFLAVVIGAAVGYFFFGWIRNKTTDITEHCH